MREVLDDEPHRELDVARQLDLPRPVAPVRQRDPAHLGVVLRRDGDLEPRLDLVVPARDRRLLGEELHEVLLGLPPDGLPGRGPDGAGVDVAQVDELAPGVPRRVLAPPGHGVPATEARSPAGVRDDRHVGAVREDLRLRVRRERRAEAVGRARGGARRHPGLLGRARLGDRRLARDPLLQEELRRLDPRVRVEPADHHVAEEDVREGDESHPLVVGEPGLHDDARRRRRTAAPASAPRSARGACSRPSRRSRAGPRRPPARAAAGSVRRRRRRQRGQGGRVGGHDELVGEPSLEPEARDAERLVLVGAGPVHEVEGRLRDSPRHAAAPAVADLLLHRHAARRVEKRSRIRPHQEERHQVLEHRRAPGDERRDALHAHDEPPEVEPVALRHVALRDGEEARQARLRGEEVVEGRVEAAGPVRVGQPVADREELALRVVEEAEAHPVRQRRGAPRQVGEAAKPARSGDDAASSPAPFRQGQQRSREVPAVDRRDVARGERREALRCRTS